MRDASILNVGESVCMGLTRDTGDYPSTMPLSDSTRKIDTKKSSLNEKVGVHV